MIDANRVTYRDAAVADARDLADLARQTFVDTFGALYPIADLDRYVSMTYGADLQRAEIEDPESRHRLAIQDGAMIGYAKAGAFKLPIAPNAKPYELHRLYVTREAKGTGVAAALMDWYIATARAWGAGALYLGVYQGNDRAQRFYARYGFVIVGEYEFEVGETRDPEYIMRAPL